MKRYAGLAVALLALAVGAHAAQPALVDAREKVFGKSIAEHTVAWWQWAMSLPDGKRAYNDPDGAQCALGQSGSIWFLAGTDGSARVNRHCTIPADRYVFFPVINMLYYAARGAHPSCAQVRAGAAANNEFLQYAIVKIDGKPVADVKRFRAATEQCFDVYSRAGYMRDAQEFFPAAADGYWIMLKPLSPGEHRISVAANYANPAAGADGYGKMMQYFDYTLEIVAPGT